MFDPQTELGTDVAEFAELPAKTWLLGPSGDFCSA